MVRLDEDAYCFICKTRFITSEEIKKHFKNVHRNYQSDEYCCKACVACTYVNLRNLIRHFVNHHCQPNRYIENFCDVPDESLNQDIDYSMQFDIDQGNERIEIDQGNERIEIDQGNERIEIEIGQSDEHQDVKDDNDQIIDILKKHLLKQMVNVMSDLTLTRKKQNMFIDLVKEALKSINDYHRTAFQEIIDSKDYNKEKLTAFSRSHFDNENLDQIFKNFKNMNKMQSIIGPYPMPRKVLIRNKPDQLNISYINSERVISTRHFFYQYIPIIETLSYLLQNENLRNLIQNESNYQIPNVFSSYRDGQIFSKSEFFKSHPNCIRLTLFVDEADPCSGLGPRASKNKITTLAFQIQNIPKKYNSTMTTVFPVIMAKYSDIKENYCSFFINFAEDLKKLYCNGHSINLPNGSQYKFHVALASVAADTLAFHGIFGLMSPSAKQFCRMCQIDRNGLKSTDPMPEYPEKDMDWYIQATNAIKKSSDECSIFGIRYESLLNTIGEFHLTNNFTFDPMHDLLEGIVPQELSLVLGVFLRKNFFTIDQINGLIQNFDYGFSEKSNRPEHILKERLIKQKRIKQAACQSWLLLRAFPFIFTNRGNIDEDEKDDLIIYQEMLDLICYLIQITQYSFSPRFTIDMINPFKNVIKKHDHLKNKLFPGKRINKDHHIFHYPRCIEQSGPIVLHSCLIFERRNAFISSQIKATKNYINLPKSIADRQAMKMAIDLNDWNWNDRLEFKTKKMFFSDTKFSERGFNFGLNEIEIVRNLKFNGILFKNNLFVSINDIDQYYETFGKIIQIAKIGEDFMFLLKLYDTMDYNDEMAAYRIEETEIFQIFNLNQLFEEQTFDVWKIYNDHNNYISARTCRIPLI